MELKIWTVDAFAGKAFEGNPAAIMPLDTWLPDTLMQQIAAENNLSETAFLVAEPERGPEHYHLRWFTPEVEVPLCGHATLGSAFVLFTHVHPEADLLVFRTLSGDLRVARRPDGLLAMELPAFVATPHPKGPDIARALGSALRRTPQEVFSANYPVAVFGSEADVAALQPGAELAAVLAEFGESGLTATARASRDGFDFVTRFFAPAKGILEDPVTGSAHAAAAPFWARRLGQERLTARQISARGGTLICTVIGDRVILQGRCVPYLEGVIRL
ncbi:MAG TPA: isomerase [Alphaproteobacteria bacterium]|nr:isomerase [Alphaproteobacteria bacterium]